MRASAFEYWAHRHGGIGTPSARSYVSYLATVENDYRIDLDADWKASQLAYVRGLLSSDRTLNGNTRRNRLSALSKYEDFCSATGSH
jgi:hypothetical protein